MKLDPRCICTTPEKFIPKKVQRSLCECLPPKPIETVKIQLSLCPCPVKIPIDISPKLKIKIFTEICYESMIDEIVHIKLCDPKPVCKTNI